MTVTILGTQFGDEGKGGAVDIFGGAADVVVRYQGGANAGHTVIADGETFELSLLPSGVVRGTTCVVGPGCVVDPETLFAELDALRERGLDPDVRVAERAHVVMPYHQVLDGIEEDAKAEADQDVGTTGRGIGPTYEDKAGRRGVRVGDLSRPDLLRDRLAYAVPQKRAVAESVYGLDAGEAFDVDHLVETYGTYGDRLAEEDLTVDCGAFLQSRMDDGAQVLFEGAQGTLLDVDHGTYPYVTSSNPTAGGVATGSGLGPGTVGGEVVGVVKGYLTRVGTGPMPTELGGVAGQTPDHDPDAVPDDERELATRIRDDGGEYGTVTGRPRRVGWLDVPQLRHAARTSGLTGLVVGHLDVLAGLDEVRAGHAYDLDGEERLVPPTVTERWADCEVSYRTFDGWPDADWDAVADAGYEALPENAKTYVEYVASELAADVYAVGVGPGREETVVVRDPFA
jgi:adenylosuccinate synthase